MLQKLRKIGMSEVDFSQMAEQAKSENRKLKLGHYHQWFCTDDLDDCDSDTIYVYVNPDGTMTTEHTHSY